MKLITILTTLAISIVSMINTAEAGPAAAAACAACTSAECAPSLVLGPAAYGACIVAAAFVPPCLVPCGGAVLPTPI